MRILLEKRSAPQRSKNGDIEDRCVQVDDVTDPPSDNNADFESRTRSTKDEVELPKSIKLLNARTLLIIVLIIFVGASASAAISSLGISSVRRDQEAQFEQLASSLFQKFEIALEGYIFLGLWVHEACQWRSKENPYGHFRDLYNYVADSGIRFRSLTCALNVTDEMRLKVEDETRRYLAQHFPDVPYNGFIGFETDPITGISKVANRTKQPFYFPVHFVEPAEMSYNRGLHDFDLYSSPTRRQAIDEAIALGKPAVTERQAMLTSSNEYFSSMGRYGVTLIHPGKKRVGNGIPKHVSAIPISFPDLLSRALTNAQVHHKATVYVYDSTSNKTHPNFMGGAQVRKDQTGNLTFILETDLVDVRKSAHVRQEKTLTIASREWTFVVTADRGHEANRAFIILGGTMIFVATLCLSLWVYTNTQRITRINQIRADVEAEKALLKIEHAKEAAKYERELNDFVAHEVRNPLNSAMSANTFVSSSVNEAEPLKTEEIRKSVREDVQVIENSLQFINDFLRNMLDMHRAASNQLKIEEQHVDLLHDILQPVASMLYRRGEKYSVEIQCPAHLVVRTDPLRVKQIILNLGRNAAKFVEEGFIRLRAYKVKDGTVQICVEDSGPGIPSEKHDILFQKFQDSLDALNQGTGIGLSLCKSLSGLLGGRIWLDNTYNSGLDGRPGARFVVDLNTAAIPFDDSQFSNELLVSRDQVTIDLEATKDEEENIPESLSVLFVDDDFTLRKLFVRSVARVTKGWCIEQAASGEAAIRLIEEGKKFDLIFMDQYMASVNKQLLGTEAVRELRARGVTSLICGLSANDMEKSFKDAGADSFIMKPFPCEKVALQKELSRIFQLDQKSSL